MLRGDNGTTADGAAEKLDIDDGQHQAESFFCLRLQLAGMPITAGILYPFFGLLLSQIIAATAMSFSPVSVFGNTLRLRSVEI